MVLCNFCWQNEFDNDEFACTTELAAEESDERVARGRNSACPRRLERSRMWKFDV